MYRKINYHIYLLLLSTVCVNPSVHSSDRSQNIPSQVTSSAHLFNSSLNQIKEQNQMNSPPVINSQYNDFEKNDYTLQNTATSSSEDDDSSWGLFPLNSSESDSSRCLLDELRAIFESEFPEREDNISENSSFSTSRFMIPTLVEENPLDNTARETSNSTLSSMEKEALYNEMLTVTRTECRAVLNPEKKYDEYDDRNFFKAFFSGLFLNVKRDCSNKYNPKQIKICLCILQSLGYSSREIVLYGKIDGHLGLGYLPPNSYAWYANILQDLKLANASQNLKLTPALQDLGLIHALQNLKLTTDELTLVTNHISSHQNMKKPKIGGIYQKYNSIFTKRRAHSK